MNNDKYGGCVNLYDNVHFCWDMSDGRGATTIMWFKVSADGVRTLLQVIKVNLDD